MAAHKKPRRGGNRIRGVVSNTICENLEYTE